MKDMCVEEEREEREREREERALYRGIVLAWPSTGGKIPLFLLRTER
jgi:hypothetical protein